MKRKLALGNQEFSEVIGNNCIYVDKTENIFQLINSGKYYFLSRPRRFGKSLLANTIKELFLGSKELFKGLWIYDRWDWEKTYPVIKISFSNISHNVIGLEDAIHNQLGDIANKYNITLQKKSYPEKFRQLITELSQTAQVAIIIDEYDKPIIDYMDDIPQAEINKKVLKNFYSVLKDADKHIKFLFITGVSKFSQVSIFSDLNNLIDITINRNYSQIVGWTKDEVIENFPDYISELAEDYKDIFPDIMEKIKEMYNGYSWDGKTKVYNPVSLMNLFQQKMFRNYWFTTGTPTMLLDIIKSRRLNAFDIESSTTSDDILNSYDFASINLNSLLFQTGYLTIKSIDKRTGRMILDYPNQEVAESFSKNIVCELTSGDVDKNQTLLYRIIDSFNDNNVDLFIKLINNLFKTIPYTIIEEKESYYHSLFYLVMKLSGYDIESEILTIDGRIDAVIKTSDNIFVIEFKINQSAKKAIQQIKEKAYADKYFDEKRPVSLLGINFDTEKRKVEDWVLETL